MARLTGFEPVAYCLEGSCSIQLSYRRMETRKKVRVNYKSLAENVSRTLTEIPVICLTNRYIFCGAVAQLGEHNVRNVGVAGSIPVSSTIF